ncbi:MAG: VOC family protein [Anaerolineae bacterium]|nr:VOC family protein [Anaerolineae bacterium]
MGKLTPMIPAGNDFKATVAFYVGKLGFKTTYEADDMVIIQRSDVEIMLLNNDDPHTASQTSFRIQVADVNTLYHEYQAQSIAPFHDNNGAGLGGLQTTPWGTREFAVRDLAGVCITFYQSLLK